MAMPSVPLAEGDQGSPSPVTALLWMGTGQTCLSRRQGEPNVRPLQRRARDLSVSETLKDSSDFVPHLPRATGFSWYSGLPWSWEG